MNRWFLDPLFLGRYPDDLMVVTGWPASAVADGDLDTIGQPPTRSA